MNRKNLSRMAAVGLALGNTLLITACGPERTVAVVPPSTPSTSSGNQPATGSHSGGGQTDSTTSSPSGNTSGVALQSLTFGDVQVQVPSEWTKHAIGGSGDWGGYKLVNPNDANQQVVVVSSSCVGCYMDQSGHPDPRLVIPQSNASDIHLSENGMTATYSIGASGGGDAGTGQVTISKDGAGYGYVEVYLPEGQGSLASQIVGTFKVS